MNSWFLGNEAWRDHYFDDRSTANFFGAANDQNRKDDRKPAAKLLTEDHSGGLRNAVRNGGLEGMRRVQEIPLPHGAPLSKRELGLSLMAATKSGAADLNRLLDMFVQGATLTSKFMDGRESVKKAGLSKKIIRAKEMGYVVRDFDSDQKLNGTVEFKVIDKTKSDSFVVIKGAKKSIYRIPNSAGIPLQKSGLLVFEKGRFVMSASEKGVGVDSSLHKSFSKDKEGKQLLDVMKKSAIKDQLIGGVTPLSDFSSKGFKERNTRLEYKGLFPSVDKKGNVVANHIFYDHDLKRSFSTNDKKVSRDVKRGDLVVGKISPYNIVSSRNGSVLMDTKKLEVSLNAKLFKAKLKEAGFKVDGETEISLDKKTTVKATGTGSMTVGGRGYRFGPASVASKVFPQLKVLAAARAATKKESNTTIEATETKTMSRSIRRR